MAKARSEPEWQASLGTDGAGFLLYHPADLAHLKAEWVNRPAAVRKEFAAGTLVAFTTSGQGQYLLRLTGRPLGEREVRWVAKSCEYRYTVRHGRVFVDNGDCLPGEARQDPGGFPAQWVEVPEGHYRVTVYAIKWYAEPGALDERERRTSRALPDYIIYFEPVPDLSAVTPPKKLPAVW